MHSLTFHSTQFEIVDRNGQPWLRSPQIAEALGYSQTNRITDVYNRNADEFTEEMTALVELDTAGGKQTVRIFSLRGAHLLAMFARTEGAKEFRRWVLDVLEKETGNDPHPSLITRRWLISYDFNGKEIVKEVPMDACVMTRAQLLQALVTPGETMVSTEELFEFAMAALTNLKARSDYMAVQLKKARDAGFKV